MLTTNQIKLMKTADTICADYLNEGEVSQLRLIKKGLDEWGMEKTETIPVGVQFESYDNVMSIGKYKDGKLVKPKNCFYHEPQYDFSIKGIGAVARFLRKNDKLTLVWRFGNSSENTKGAKTVKGETLYCYELLLKVTRGKTITQFLIESHFSPMNLASMIRMY